MKHDVIGEIKEVAENIGNWDNQEVADELNRIVDKMSEGPRADENTFLLVADAIKESNQKMNDEIKKIMADVIRTEGDDRRLEMFAAAALSGITTNISMEELHVWEIVDFALEAAVEMERRIKAYRGD